LPLIAKLLQVEDYSFGRRRFAVAGPSTWNSLPDSLRDPELSLNTSFKRRKVLSALEIFLE